MEIVTASAAVSFAVKAEEDSGNLYERLAEKYVEDKGTLLSLAKENKSNKTSIQRAYYGTISDKLEACFCFEELDTDDYSIEIDLPKGLGYSDILRKVLNSEEEIQRFLLDAAKKSGNLIPDVSWTFARISEKRKERVDRLKSLLDKADRKEMKRDDGQNQTRPL